jgi:hypothetical protein
METYSVRNKIEYLIDSKEEYNPTTIKEYQCDIFISCFNDSERVRSLYSSILAEEKIWIIIPEYKYEKTEYPKEFYLYDDSSNEADLIINTIGKCMKNMNEKKICIDITGFMRPQIIFLINYLYVNNIRRFDLFYSEPSSYSKKSETSFALSDVEEVRQIASYEGYHNISTDNDVLILGVGYDHELMSRVILTKDKAHLIVLFGLPSLSADMYQESILRFQRVSALSTRISNDNTFFASANDPFVTAGVLSTIYKQLASRGNISNLYLCPLATKPQALGFSLFYLNELKEKPASIIFPFSPLYSKETSKGIGRIWLYPIYL